MGAPSGIADPADQPRYNGQRKELCCGEDKLTTHGAKSHLLTEERQHGRMSCAWVEMVERVDRVEKVERVERMERVSSFGLLCPLLCSLCSVLGPVSIVFCFPFCYETSTGGKGNF